ncbi:MAG: hypothetical protein KGD66_01535 [Candidatus Lokiarchaeota archaeon]|nr:hypothetical protein [Candidatus Lokiarchaeota archaeon]
METLREEKIEFWKSVLEEYNKDREGYNLVFRTKSARQEDDLDRVSRGEIPLR